MDAGGRNDVVGFADNIEPREESNVVWNSGPNEAKVKMTPTSWGRYAPSDEDTMSFLKPSEGFVATILRVNV
jgi:hypothetical protein